MRSATGNSKTPFNYAHTSRPKAASSHHYTAEKKRQTDRSRNRRTHEVPLIAGCSRFTRKNTRFRAPAPPQNRAHYTAAKKKANRPQPQPLHTWGTYHRPAAATWHGKTQGCVLSLPPNNIAHATFMQPFQCDLQPQIQEMQRTTHTASRTTSPLPIVTNSLRHHFPSSPLPFVTLPFLTTSPSSPLPFLTTSHRHHLPSSPPPSSPLPFITTSHRPHFPSSPLPFITTSLRHHFPSSPPPIVPISLPHHSPSSPLPSVATSFITTSHRQHFPSSSLPFITTSLRHHPVS